MNPEEVLVCLVSGQPMPNIIPAFVNKPHIVVLLTTTQEKATADHIKKVYSKNGMKCEIHEQFIDAYDVFSIRRELEKIYDKYCNHKLTMNITGGTKLMAIAAYEFFREKKQDILYVDTLHSSILKFKEAEILVSKYDNLNISVKDYLLAHGIYPDEINRKTAGYNEVFMNIIDSDVKSFLNFSKKLRSFREIEGKFISGKYSVIRKKSEKRNESVGRIAKTTQLKFYDFEFNGKIVLENEITDLQYYVGYWLEDYTQYLLDKRNPNDAERGFKFKHSSGAESEIDVLITKNGMLHLISCKSGSFTKKDLFELEGLRQLAGGTFAKAYIVVPPKPGNYPEIRLRAKQLRIEFLTILELKKRIEAGIVM